MGKKNKNTKRINEKAQDKSSEDASQDVSKETSRDLIETIRSGYKSYKKNKKLIEYLTWRKNTITRLQRCSHNELTAIYSMLTIRLEESELGMKSAETLNSQLILFVLGAASGSIGGLISVAANDNISFNFLYLLIVTVIGVGAIIVYCIYLRRDSKKNMNEYLFYKELITIIAEIEKQQ